MRVARSPNRFHCLRQSMISVALRAKFRARRKPRSLFLTWRDARLAVEERQPGEIHRDSASGRSSRDNDVSPRIRRQKPAKWSRCSRRSTWISHDFERQRRFHWRWQTPFLPASDVETTRRPMRSILERGSRARA